MPFTRQIARLFARKIAPPVRMMPPRFRPRLEEVEDRTVPTPVLTVAWEADATEGGSVGLLRFTRTGSTANTLSFTFGFSGTAAIMSDYYPGAKASFNVGEYTYTFPITPNNDSTSELTETVVATLNSNAAYTIGGTGAATVNIFDNDANVVTVAKLADASEGGPPGGFRFTRTGDLSSALTVNYTPGGTATPETDYATLSGSVTIPAGLATFDRTVRTYVDGVTDIGETVGATIAANAAYTVGAAAAATFLIADAVAPAGRVTQGLIDFASLPATGYTITVTVAGDAAGSTKSVTVDNTAGAHSPEDVRNAVKTALDGAWWRVESVGTTKLIVKNYYKHVSPGSAFNAEGNLLDITFKHTGLKDNQLPKKGLTRVAAAGTAEDSGLATTAGGTWLIGFATNTGASVLPDGVIATVTITSGTVSTPVAVTLTSGMTPADVASAIATALATAGFGFSASGGEVSFADPYESIDGIDLSFSTTGSNAAVDWLTDSVGFHNS